MRQKLDIADVEERTKIRAKYLRALENEEWSSLPGPTFVKTFLRTYAEVVGVDPHLLVEEYRAGHETRDEVDLQPLAAAPPRRRRNSARDRRPRRQRIAQRSGPPAPGVIIGVIAVAVVAFLLVLGLVSGNDSNSPNGNKAGATATQTQTTARTTPKPKPAPAPSGVNVAIAPATPTYACIDKGAGTPVVFEGTLDKARTFKDAKQLRVNLGKRGVSLTVNGKAVKIADSPDPVGFEFTPGGTKELPAGSRPCA
jgi:cytoskeletal protein RodZ